MNFTLSGQIKHKSISYLILLAMGFALCLGCSSTKKVSKISTPFITQTRVFPFSAENKPNYRIPAMVSAPNGDLLIFAEKRRKSVADVGYTDIIMTSSSDKGKSWELERILFGGNNESNADPTTLVDAINKRIYLFFLRDKKQFYMMFTNDNGKTWSIPKSIHHEIVKPEWDSYKGSTNVVNSPSDSVNKSTDWKRNWQQSYGIGPGNAGIRIAAGPKSGRLLVPIRRKDATHVIYSDDDGNSWHTGPVVVERASEAQLVELANGNIMVNSRNGNLSDSTNIKRIINISIDGGETWGKSYIDPNLEETSCNASIIRLSLVKDGQNRLLFSNPKNNVRSVKHPYGRINMAVRLSYDEGKSWLISKTIYPYASSYSALTVLNDQTIGIVYERGKNATTPYYWDELWFARFNLEWLTDGKDTIKK